MITIRRDARVIKRTMSRCPACGVDVPATVVERDGAVFMEKACAAHGEFRVRLHSDAKWYFESHGDPANAGGSCCGPGGCGATTRTDTS